MSFRCHKPCLVALVLKGPNVQPDPAGVVRGRARVAVLRRLGAGDGPAPRQPAAPQLPSGRAPHQVSPARLRAKKRRRGGGRGGLGELMVAWLPAPGHLGPQVHDVFFVFPLLVGVGGGTSM